MPTTYLLYPNVTNTLTNASVTGAADADDALRSTSDSDYVSMGSVGTSSTVDVGCQDFAPLDGDQRIARLRIIARLRNIAAGSPRFSAWIESAANFTESLHFETDRSTSYNTYTGSWNGVDHGHGDIEWTEANVNAIKMQFTDTGAGSAKLRLSYARIEADVHRRSSVFMFPPHSYIGFRAGVTLQWLFQSEGDACTRFQVKVFSAAVAEGGGFNPDSSATLYNSNEQVFAGNNSWLIPASVFTYGTKYYFYVKVSTTFPGPIAGEQWWSAWSGIPQTTVAKPTATPTLVGGTPTATSRPTLRITYADANGLPAVRFVGKIYKQPAGGWGTFNILSPPPPDASISFVDSFGSFAPGVYDFSVAPSLTNGSTYRAYVKVYLSDTTLVDPDDTWLFYDFTTSWAAPTAPTFTATSDGDLGRVQLVIKNTQNDVTAEVTVQRSLDNLNWATVRGIGDLNIGFNISAQLFDYEAPPNVLVYYRAWTETTSASLLLRSTYITLAAITVTTRYAFLKDPIDPTRNMHVVLQNNYLDRTKRRDRAFYRPLTRERPVPMRGVSTDESFTVVIVTRDVVEQAKLETLLNSDRVLLFQTARSSWYVDLSGDYTNSEYLWGDLHKTSFIDHLFTVTFIEVDAVPLDV